MMKRIAIARDEADERADLLLDDVRAATCRRAASRPTAPSTSWTAPARQHAGHQPDQAGRVAELRREHRADQRTGAGDGREVVAEHAPTGWSGSSSRRRISYAAGVVRASSSIQTLVARKAL